MFSSIGKSSTFLLLCCLWAFSAPNISAQDKQQKPISPVESPPETLKPKPETEVDAVWEKSLIDKPMNAPDVVQKSDSRERSVPEDEDNVETAEEKNRLLNVNRQTEISGFKYDFRSTGERERQFGFNNTTTVDGKQFSSRPPLADSFDDLKNSAPPDDLAEKKAEGFRWGSATRQSLMFLAVQHGYALTQPKTREALKGKFFKDYFDSVKSLRGWDDGGRFFTNYVAHPMQGSFVGFIQVQNDPKGMKQQFGASGDYWRSRMKALAWSAAWSTQFEIGPISQASIGNVGLQGKQTWEDIIVTPTLGTTLLIGEDAIDRFVMKCIERGTDNFYIVIFSRMLLSPTRTIANLFRFKTPWHRDRPREH